MSVDASKLIAALAAIRSELKQTVESSLDTLAEIAASNARSSTLFKNRSGKLRKEIKFKKDGTFSRTVIADTGYSSYVENGNDPGGGRIYPKKAKALRFVIDGKVLFRKWVRASKPRPFMANARTLMISFIPDLIHSNIERMINKHRG